TKSDFEAVGEPKDNSITLKVRETNNKYHGSIVVNFTIQKQNNKNIIIGSSAAVGGVGLLGTIMAFIRRRKRK
ncbi:hypothetical protein J2Z63_000791, partial [Mycoplasma yeatsii]|nr:hypothetical protein [Mycoplasma yeatsii]